MFVYFLILLNIYQTNIIKKFKIFAQVKQEIQRMKLIRFFHRKTLKNFQNDYS